jgi:hypothetical protein
MALTQQVSHGKGRSAVAVPVWLDGFEDLDAPFVGSLKRLPTDVAFEFRYFAESLQGGGRNSVVIEKTPTSLCNGEGVFDIGGHDDTVARCRCLLEVSLDHGKVAVVQPFVRQVDVNTILPNLPQVANFTNSNYAKKLCRYYCSQRGRVRTTFSRGLRPVALALPPNRPFLLI